MGEDPTGAAEALTFVTFADSGWVRIWDAQLAQVRGTSRPHAPTLSRLHCIWIPASGAGTRVHVAALHVHVCV